MDFTWSQIAPFIGGSASGAFALGCYLFITGRIFAKPERLQLLTQIEKQDKLYLDEREYSKQLVKDLQSLNETMRNDVVPTMTNMNQQVLTLAATVQMLSSRRTNEQG